MNALSLLPVLLCGALAAQPAQPVPQPKPAQDPNREAAEPTASERIAKLEAEIQKLRRELAQIKQVEAGGGLTARVKASLAKREIEARSIPVKAAAPQPAAAAPAQPVRRAARLLGDDEKKALAKDVICTVDGQPVTDAEFDAAVTYLKGYPSGQSEEQLKQRAMMELIQLKATMAEFADGFTQARSKIISAERRLKETPDLEFANLAKEISDCPSKAQGGDLGFFDRNRMDFSFSRASFGLKVGETSEPVATVFGYHLIKVTGTQKGDSDATDRVRASHILALSTTDQMARSRVLQRARGGQVDVAFRSDDDRRFAPDAYR